MEMVVNHHKIAFATVVIYSGPVEHGSPPMLN